jgi:hypothetical protein
LGADGRINLFGARRRAMTKAGYSDPEGISKGWGAQRARLNEGRPNGTREQRGSRR